MSPPVPIDNKTPLSTIYDPLTASKLPLGELDPLITPGAQNWSPFPFHKISSPMSVPLMAFHPYIASMHSPVQSPNQGFLFGQSPAVNIPGYTDFSCAFDGNIDLNALGQGALSLSPPPCFSRTEPKKL